MLKSLLFAPLLILFTLRPAHAESTNPIHSYCDPNKSTQIEYSKCLDGLKIKTDRELETWVNNQLFILEEIGRTTGRKSAYEMFKRSQRSFINYRDLHCKWQFLVELPSTVSAPIYKECYILTSRDRINALSRIAN